MSLGLLVSFLLLSATHAASTTWSDKVSGAYYDYSALAKDGPWEITDTSSGATLYYTYTIGSHLKTTCTTSDTSAFRQTALVGATTCEALGSYKNAKTTLLNVENPAHGIEITYDGGDSCYEEGSMRPQAIVFRVSCMDGVTKKPEWEVSSYSTPCQPVFSITHPSGCPVEFWGGRYGRAFSSLGWSLLFCL
jgi:hypothetical protein